MTNETVNGGTSDWYSANYTTTQNGATAQTITTAIVDLGLYRHVFARQRDLQRQWFVQRNDHHQPGLLGDNQLVCVVV